jgi:Right handed beta helix region/Protein of unknown function (DUF642)
MPGATSKGDIFMTTYYVSSEIGRDNNAGTSAAAPFATLQVAADHTKPGDTVLVMNGTYSNGGNDVLTISTSGTAGAPITFEAAPGATPLIDTQGAWQGIEINANYITVSGFTLVGTAGNYTLAQALAGSTPGDPTFNGNGIGVNLNSQDTPHHHIIIENNTIYNMPGAGIATTAADYLQILNNNVHDNAHWSAYGQSGITIGSSVNFDNAPGPHIIVSGNTSVNNAELVPEYRANAITDGEGIILDTNPGYTGGFLVQNNTTHGNSGPGIEVLNTSNVVISGNTTTGDLTYAPLAHQGEIFNNNSTNVTITNNNTGNPPPAVPPGELVVNGGFETGDFTGWTQSGNVAPLNGDPTQPQLWITQAAHTGNDAMGAGPIGGVDGTISQTLTTVAGQTYTFDFWLANMSGGPNDFTAKIGGVTELHLVNDAAQPYTHYTYAFTATSTSTPIEFDFMQQPSEWHLDDVSVAPAGSSPPPADERQNLPDGGYLMSVVDGSNQFAWTRQDATYDAQNHLKTLQVRYDDGSLQGATFDAAGNQPWTSQNSVANAAGQTTNLGVIYDDHTVQTAIFDTTGQPWTSQNAVYDAQGRQTTLGVIYDDGHTEAAQFDANGSQPWTSQSAVYDAHGQLIATSVIWDDGHHTDWHII